MSLFEQIKADRLKARKIDSVSETTVKLLITVIGEAELQAKRNPSNQQPTDTEMFALIKKFIDNIDDTLKIVSDENVRINLYHERGVLEGYMPTKLTKDELIAIIESNGFTDKGAFMKHMKANYAGQYDGKLASSLL